jgi:hypothetical protein
VIQRREHIPPYAPFLSPGSQFATIIIQQVQPLARSSALLTERFLEQLRLAALQSKPSLAQRLLCDSSFIRDQLKSRLQRELPPGAPPVAELKGKLQSLLTHVEERSRQRLATTADDRVQAAPVAKRAKTTTAPAMPADAYGQVLAKFEEGMQQWQELAAGGALPPPWFDDSVRALGQQLA